MFNTKVNNELVTGEFVEVPAKQCNHCVGDLTRLEGSNGIYLARSFGWRDGIERFEVLHQPLTGSYAEIQAELV